MDTPTSPSHRSYAGGAPANDACIETVEVIEIVEIEIYGRANRPPPPAKSYKVKIDHEHYVFHQPRVTGRELLVKAGKTPPENYEIEKRVHGGKYIPVGLDEQVDLSEPGIEVFETFPLDETEG